MNSTQLQLLKAAIAAETDPTFVGYRDAGSTTAMAEWFNQPSTTDAWMYNVLKVVLFEATNVGKFDNLTAGKRDAWNLLMENTPFDAGRNKVRNSIVDVWGPTDSVSVLQDCVEKATKAEAVIGGTVKVTNTVSALDRSWYGRLSGDDIVAALAS